MGLNIVLLVLLAHFVKFHHSSYPGRHIIHFLVEASLLPIKMHIRRHHVGYCSETLYCSVFEGAQKYLLCSLKNICTFINVVSSNNCPEL